MIEGVKIKNLIVHQDIPDIKDENSEKGFLIEILRNDDDLLTKFGQSTFTIAYQNTIKAFCFEFVNEVEEIGPVNFQFCQSLGHTRGLYHPFGEQHGS